MLVSHSVPSETSAAMPSKKLMGFWAFFDICLLASGIIAVVFSLVWHSPNDPLRMLVITNMDMTGESVPNDVIMSG